MVRVGSMNLGSENRLCMYHGVVGSVKQRESGKGGGICISVEMNLILG